MRIFVLFFLILLFPVSAIRAQGWVEQYKNAVSNYQNGKLGAAYKYSKASLGNYLKEDGGLTENYAAILHLLSTICYDSALYEEGVIHAEKEISVRKEITEVETLELATALYNLGSLYLSVSRKDAEQVLTEALIIYQQYLPADHENIITCYWKLGTAYLNQGEWSKSRRYFSKGFDLHGDPEEVTIDYITACYDMATASAADGEIEDAITYYKKVADIYTASGYEETLQNQFVQLHLGDMYKALREHTTAVEFYDNVINLQGLVSEGDKNVLDQALKGKAFCLQAMGRGDEATLIYTEAAGGDPSSLNNAAAIAYKEGRLKDAENLYRKALDLLKVDSLIGKESLEITTNLINVYLQMDKLDTAGQLIKEARGLVDSLQLSNHPLNSSLLIRQARLFQRRNDYITSNSLYLEAEGILKNTVGENTAEYVNLLNNRAVLQLDQGYFHEAEKLLEKSIAIAEAIDYPTTSLINLYNNKAALYQELGRFTKAGELLEKGIGLLQSEKINPVISANTYRQKGLLDIQLGNFGQAHQMLASAEEIFTGFYGKDHTVLAQHSIDMARLLQAQGNYADAEKLFISALQKMQSTLGDNHPDYLAAINSFGVFYQTMGNYDEAIKQFMLSRDGYLKIYGKEHPGYATSIENISSTYQLLGQNDQVEPLLLEAISVDQAVYGENHPKYGISLHNLATFYLKKDSFELARPLFKDALEIYKKTYGTGHSSYAATLFNLAIVNQESGNFEEAEDQLEQTLEIRKKILGREHPDYAFTLLGLAQLYHNMDEMEKARPYYKEGIEQYLHQINSYFPALSEKEKSAFFNKIKPGFSAFADFAISYNKSTGDGEVIKDLCDLRLSTKAILLNATNKVRNRIMDSRDDGLIAKYHQWTRLKEQLVKAVALTPEEQQKLEITPSHLEDRINTLEKELSQQSALFSQTFDKEKIIWQDVQKRLVEGEAAIEIMRVSKRYITDSVFYAALIIKPSAEPVVVIMPQGNRLEQRFYNYYRNSIEFDEQDELSYRYFWAVLNPHLKDTEMCYISADGIYNKISLPTLFNSVNGKHLIDEYNIRLLSNIREIVEKPDMMEQIKYAVVFGSPDFNSGTAISNYSPDPELTRIPGFSDKGIPALPGTMEEVENLRDILNANEWQTEVYIEQSATEKNLKAVSNPAILHIATHGFFMSDIGDDRKDIGIHLDNPEANPLFRSGLLFSGAASGLEPAIINDSEDGILTAYEAMNLNLDQTDIVVLSACETGLGQIRNGEGVYGLQRALIVAGAKSVLMSLWKVHDETTMELMTAFYNGLLDGKDKFTAFKEAQLLIREKYYNPFYWGAFVMMGQ